MSAIDLLQLNVWLDYIFTTLYVIVLVALSLHFIVGNVLVSGRAKRRFIGWEWPHHDGPPVPFLPKFLHFQHVASMIVLAITGLYIRFPGFLIGDVSNARTFMRGAHYVAMIIVTINLVWRLWYTFYSSQRDYREFAITKMDIITAPKVILYYIFVKSDKPHLAKYNVMQKATYTAFAPLLILQAITGFALVTFPFEFLGNTSPRDWILGWNLGLLLGSTDLAGWYMRIAHYVINWLFILLTTIHVYLSVSEDLPAFLNFFGLGFLDKNHGGHHGDEGHEGHGDDHDHGHVHAPVISKAD